MAIDPFPNLRHLVSNPETPWHASPEVFQELQREEEGQNTYKRCVITQKNPEWCFVHSYFNHNRPKNLGIKSIQLIHNPSLTKRFEAEIPGMEEEASKPIFEPTWQKEGDFDLRKRVIERFEKGAAHFSPFNLAVSARKIQRIEKIKILPMWHGTSREVCEGISETGFTYFGKHQILKGAADSSNTDQGYFGSGIYFTNSAKYAAEIYGKGNMILAWVSLRIPFPVVSDHSCQPPDKPKDMKMLEGQGAYRNYNAHYIPVISIDPRNEECDVYYPCSRGQNPVCDELVVFQKSQALAQFWVELTPDLIQNPIPTFLRAGKMIEEVVKLLANGEVQQQIELFRLLEGKKGFLIQLKTEDPVGLADEVFYEQIRGLLDESGKVRQAALYQLLEPLQEKARRGSFDFSVPIEVSCPLVGQKLERPHLPLSIEQSIELLSTCISYGNHYVQRIKEKEVFIVIGNTGAGKSTFVNYLAGCTMELKKPQELGVKGTGKIVVVKPPASGGRYEEIMPIGHTKQSKTFVPQIETDPDQVNTYCDCPGFLDNRGAEINIANAVNVRNALIQAGQVKVLILINYHSLKADRGRGLSDMLKICSNLFGNVNNLEKYKDSLLLGVTQVPTGGELDLQDLKEWIVEDTPTVMQSLAERLFISDPLDRELDGGWTREKCLEELRELVPITEPGAIFKTVLNDSDEKRLIEISEELGTKMQEHLKKGEFQTAATYFKQLERLGIIEHITVERLINQNHQKLGIHFQRIIDAFKEHCHFEHFSSAEEILKQLEKAMKSFKTLLDDTINLEHLRLYYSESESRASARKLKEQLMQEQLKSAQGEIKELIKILEEQKKSTQEELKKQEEQYKELFATMTKRMEEIQENYERQEQELQEENILRLAQKEEELKLAMEMNQKEAQKQIQQEIEKLEQEYQEKLKQTEKEKAEMLALQQKQHQETERKIAEEKAVKEAKIKKIEQQQAAKALELKKGERPLLAFGKEDWARYFGDIGIEPPLPADITEILKSPCPYWSSKKIEDTHLLMLIPKTVNSRAFTLDLLKDLIQRPQGGGHGTQYRYYDNDVQKQHGNKGVSGSYWALVTKDVIPNSRNKTFDEQRALLKSPYAVPGALEMATAILMNHAKTGEKLYPDNPDTYTRCQEKVCGDKYRVVVGSFGSSGLFVNRHDFDYVYDDVRRDGYGGLGGVRKFSS